MISVTNIEIDPQAGEIAVGRIFSGKIVRGQDVYLVNNKQVNKVQQIYIWKGPQRFQVESALAGNQIGMAGFNLLSVFGKQGKPISLFDEHVFGEQGLIHVSYRRR